MTSADQGEYHVAVVGAGPAGLYAAQELAGAGIHVTLFNRDIKPGGLAEYGIYHDKHKMKEGLRRQFRQILQSPRIDYLGNVTISQEDDLTLADLRDMGFQAILVTVGAQGTKWLGLPGEHLRGVYHAKDIVYHYNHLPPFSLQQFHIGRRAAVIGVGNVMVDIAHWLIRDVRIDHVIAVARRGPAEVKFTKKELQSVFANLDVAALTAEIARVAPVMQAVGQEPAAAEAFILSAEKGALPAVSNTRFTFQFLTSPSAVLGDDDGQVNGLEVEDTTLVRRNGDTRAKGLGTKRVLDVDTVVFCIGDRVDITFGLPVEWNEFVKNPSPRFPIDGISYEAYDPETQHPIEDVFVAGWARQASDGLVGVARKDGVQGAQAVLQYLHLLKPVSPEQRARLAQHLDHRLLQLGHPVVRKEDWARLELAEQAEAQRLGVEEFKFNSNQEMLAAMNLAPEAAAPLAEAVA